MTQVRKLGAEQANVVTYTVIIRAQNRGGKLLPGMTANAEITADRAANVLRIANDATRFQPPRELQEALGAGQGVNAAAQPAVRRVALRAARRVEHRLRLSAAARVARLAHRAASVADGVALAILRMNG